MFFAEVAFLMRRGLRLKKSEPEGLHQMCRNAAQSQTAGAAQALTA
jgi:hypothetical protein